MHPLHTSQQALVWHQQGGVRRQYELRAGEAQVAGMRWEGFFGGQAIGETESGRWSFKQVGFFNPYIAVRKLDASGSSDPVMSVQLGFNGNAYFADKNGHSYVWKPMGYMQDAWGWTMDYELLLSIKPIYGSKQQTAQLQIEKNKLSENELSLLVLTGWYLLESNGSIT